jgi:hypothetical protein
LRDPDLPGAGPRAGVVLLHGLAGTSLLLRRLEKALRRAGFATLNLDYQSRKKPLDELAADIHPAVASFAAEHAGPTHFVALAHRSSAQCRRRPSDHHVPGGGTLSRILARILGSVTQDHLA